MTSQQNDVTSVLTNQRQVLKQPLLQGRHFTQEEILSQIKLLGANNIIIQPIVEQEEGSVEEEASNLEEKKPFSPGLTIADAKSRTCGGQGRHFTGSTET